MDETRERRIAVLKEHRFHRLSTKDRGKLYKFVLNLSNAGLQPMEIAQKLNSMKYPSASGRPWTPPNIGSVLARARHHKEKARLQLERLRESEFQLTDELDMDEPEITRPAPVPAAPPIQPSVEPRVPEPRVEPPKPPLVVPGRFPASIQLMLEDPELSDAQKMAMLCAAKVRLPPSVQLILEDSELQTSQKMGMIAAFMGAGK